MTPSGNGYSLLLLVGLVALVYRPWRTIGTAMRLGWALTTALLVAALLVGAAHAGTLGPSHAREWRPAPIARSWRTGFTEAAITYWHRAAVCGQPIFRMQQTVPIVPGVQPDSQAWVLDDGPQTCVIYLLQPDWRDLIEINPLRACMLLGHEYSHLLGYPDAPVPGSLLDHYIRHQRDRPCARLVGY